MDREGGSRRRHPELLALDHELHNRVYLKADYPAGRPAILDVDRIGSLSPSEAERPPPDERSFLIEMPDDVLVAIFSHFNVKERIRVSQTCHRFLSLLTDCPCTALTDVAVVNIFEKRIWTTTVKKNSVSRIVMNHLHDLHDLRAFLRHIKSVESLKIWFSSRAFVKAVIEVVSTSIPVYCVDVYPYSDEIPIADVAATFPDVSAISMRPHGTDYFFVGLKISEFPDFCRLRTLCMDSFELLPPGELPHCLKNLDYANRRLEHFDYFISVLSKLPELELLSLSHIELNAPDRTRKFLEAISVRHLPKLQYLYFKFGRVSTWNCDDDIKLRLKVLKFDLVVDLTQEVAKGFIELCQETLQIFNINIILEDEGLLKEVLSLCPTLKKHHIKLHMAVMQKTEDQTRRTKPEYCSGIVVPPEFSDVVSRLEGSFIWDKTFFPIFFDYGWDFKYLQEAKFIQCRALTNAAMKSLATSAALLKKLTVISCEDVDQDGLHEFAVNAVRRATSSPLKVLYKSNGSLAPLYGELLLSSLRHHDIHYWTKTFPDSNSSTGEGILFRDNKHKRTVVYKNFNPEDSNRILGIVIDDVSTSEDVDDVDDDDDQPGPSTLATTST